MRYQKLTINVLALGALLAAGSHSTSAVASSGIVDETIIYLHEDGRGHFDYSTTRTNRSSSVLFIDKKESLDDYLYIYPKDYKLDTKTDEQANIITFPEGSFSTIKSGYFDEGVTVDQNGVFTFNSWDGKKRKDGHFGFWMKDNNFTEFMYAWVFPDSFEILGHESNRKGKWIRQKNTLFWYGEDVNDMTFTLRYRPHGRVDYDALSSALADTGGIELEHQKHTVRVALEGTVLFPAGRTELSPKGQAVIKRVVKALGRDPTMNIVVEGHTDNLRVSAPLSETFSTNWELSAARALSVVHYLEELGFPEQRLEIRAYGPYRPRASNDTAEGRAQNRRIELVVAVEEQPR